ncbi:fluoride efflux transporter CrcB [Altererythrobacter sp. SALINAS58]|uniref:fluoride efflux transporter CrcB n=1 Tax=Alteripontixanthobacter muriae TaxID=2705546 RepID=UPI001575FE14|nr:fluoride efflux transporter CrcB [Alteripontixanthobacter muriae]NTZ42271.1 fluoride efflux transporter CrcB [Alteripontixanthobacter muriae]
MTGSAPSIAPLAASLQVGLGGAIGAVLRYQAGRGMTSLAGQQGAGSFPWATLSVNVLGSLAMGLLFGWLARQGSDAETTEPLRLFLGVGLLGGFTTFSAFSLDMMLLIERGQPGLALLYAASSMVAGLAGLYIGLALIRMLGQG